jgi:hypothetical protein
MKRFSAAVSSILLFLILSSVCGCGHKQPDPAAGASVQMIDASKLRPAFASASEENKAMVETIMMSIQSSDYRTATSTLEKLNQTSSISEEQRKIVANVKDQVEKKQVSLAPPPGQ